MPYRLTRTLPDGSVKHPTPTKTKHQSARYIMYTLYDNTSLTKKEATAFAAQVQDAPDGTEHAHPSGYVFRIDKITP